MIAKNYYRKEFWKTLSAKSYILLLLAVFFTFSSIGFISDLWSEGQYSTGHLIFNVFFSGIIGAGYAFAATRNWKLIPLVLLLQIAITFMVPETVTPITTESLAPLITKSRLIIDGFGILVMIMLGYIFFIIFITSEGIPQVRLRTEIELAAKMHDVLVPPIQFKNKRFEIFGQSQPFYEIGGDLIDMYQQGEALVCYTADVSGHGVGASLLMGMFKSAMHTSLQTEQSLTDIVNNCNKSLYQLKNPSMFLTASLIKFDRDHKAEFTVAGHLPILHFQSQKQNINYLSIKQIPLSVKTDYNFITQKTAFESGDIFIFLSDGLTEVLNKSGIEYGLQPIEKIISEKSNLPLKEIYDAIIADINRFGIQKDDQSLMLIRCI